MLLAVSRLKGVGSSTDDLNGLLATILGISIVVSVGMIGLTTLFDQQALALTRSTLTVPHFGGHLGKQGLGLDFSSEHLDKGIYVIQPPLFGIARGSFDPTVSVSWATRGSGTFGGDEKGFVTYDVKFVVGMGGFDGTLGQVTASFSNPASGSNTCAASTTIPGYAATCNIASGNVADANFYLSKIGDSPPGTTSTFTAAPKSPHIVLGSFSQCSQDLPNVQLFQRCIRGA